MPSCKMWYFKSVALRLYLASVYVLLNLMIGLGGTFTVARLHRVELWVKTTYVFVPCSFWGTFYLGMRLWWLECRPRRLEHARGTGGEVTVGNQTCCEQTGHLGRKQLDRNSEREVGLGNGIRGSQSVCQLEVWGLDPFIQQDLWH